MAQTITIDFTDEQWEIVRDNYPIFLRDNDDEVLTLENLSSHLVRDLIVSIFSDMRLRDVDLSPFKSAFDV